MWYVHESFSQACNHLPYATFSGSWTFPFLIKEPALCLRFYIFIIGVCQVAFNFLFVLSRLCCTSRVLRNFHFPSEALLDLMRRTFFHWFLHPLVLSCIACHLHWWDNLLNFHLKSSWSLLNVISFYVAEDSRKCWNVYTVDPWL